MPYSVRKRIEALPQKIQDFILEAGKVADEQKLTVCLVGGFVRDLFSMGKNFDLDLVVEGDGIGFASLLARRWRLRMLAHKRFGTATLTGLEHFKIDVASSRRETYEFPGALPAVFPGSLRDDLYRRDFSINAMAVSINEHSYGELIDFYSGRSDLKKRLIRVMHPYSFIDDPTRILRAIRFEQRFGFRIEPQTLQWLKDAQRSGLLSLVQKHRLRDELVLFFREKNIVAPLSRLETLCGFDFVSARMRLPRGWKRLFRSAQKQIDWFLRELSHKRRLDSCALFLELFFFPLTLSLLKKAMRDFAFHKSQKTRILSFRMNGATLIKKIKKSLLPSHLYRLLEPLSYEVILGVAALAGRGPVERSCKLFLSEYNGARLLVNGDDLHALGLERGPRFKAVLNKILDAKIDLKLTTKEEELTLAAELIEFQKKSRPAHAKVFKKER